MMRSLIPTLLMELLAIRLGGKAAKSLVIPEGEGLNFLPHFHLLPGEGRRVRERSCHGLWKTQ